MLAIRCVTSNHLTETDSLTETIERLVRIVVPFERFEFVFERQHLSWRWRFLDDS